MSDDPSPTGAHHTPGSPSPAAPDPRELDSRVPHSARVWNYLLGGRDNYEADRVVGDAIAQAAPGIVDVARTSRHFLHRAIHHLAAEEGVHQYLDIGTGLPTVDNTHEIAQRAAPSSRIVYVDNDPLVLAHARALLTSTPEGSTRYIQADVHQPEAILEAAAESLDFDRPIALILMGIMGHTADYGQALDTIRRLLRPLPSGSFLVHYDTTNTTAEMVRAQDRYNASEAVPYHLRTPEQIAEAFEGLALLEPGVVRCTDWRPEFGPGSGAHGRTGTGEVSTPVDAYCGVGRKP